MNSSLSRQPDWFLHAHLAATLDKKLDILKNSPHKIILAAADGNESYRLLKARYPKAEFQEFDQREDYLYWSQETRKAEQKLWQKLSSHLPVQQATNQLPPTEQADMIWSNLGLIHQTDPIHVIENWAEALQTDGLLFFSHFGPDTFLQLFEVWQTHGIIVRAPMLIDMHDLGDMLLQHGFYDPVMDMSKLTLQYVSVERMIEDMRVAGLWQSLQFEDEEEAIRILIQHWQSGEIHDITLELIYGHGIKKQLMPEHTATVQFYPQPPHS